MSFGRYRAPFCPQDASTAVRHKNTRPRTRFIANTPGLTSFKYKEFTCKSPWHIGISKILACNLHSSIPIQFVNTWGIMKIQVSMPDSLGTFASQSIEAEENAQVLFASFLPAAPLAESMQPSEGSNTGSDLVADDMSRMMINVSAGLEQSGLNDDGNLIDTGVSKLSDVSISPDRPDTLPVNRRHDTALPIIKQNETVLPQTTPNLIPNLVEQLNTLAADVDHVLNAENPMEQAVVMIADRTMLKKTDLMTDEPALPEMATGKTMLELVRPLASDLADTKTEIFLNQMPGRLDEQSQELTATDNISLRVDEKDSVKAIAVEHSALPDRHSLDTMLANVADFLNKRLDTTATSNQNKSGEVISLNTAVYRELDNNSALKAFQYSSNGLPASLKVDSYFATLKVYPPDLGQVTADIQINKGMTELTLRADNPQVRHFIESHLPQLRDSFENSHINLGEVTVQNNSSDSRHDFQNNQQPFFGNVSIQQKQNDARAGAPVTRQSNLIIDTYA